MHRQLVEYHFCAFQAQHQGFLEARKTSETSLQCPTKVLEPTGSPSPQNTQERNPGLVLEGFHLWGVSVRSQACPILDPSGRQMYGTWGLGASQNTMMLSKPI